MSDDAGRRDRPRRRRERRFGGVKQLAELRGRPLLAHAVEAMLAVPALEPVIVVLGHAADEIRARGRLRRAPTVVVAADWDERAVGLAAARRRRRRRRRRGRDHARRPAVHHAGGDRRRARPAAPATTPCARPTTASPGIPSCSAGASWTRSAELRATRARAICSRASAYASGRPAHLCSAADIDTREELARL